METVEFRIWHKKLKCYVENKYHYCPALINGVISQEDHILEMFTGLYDAKGVKIFEGDIIDQVVYLEDDPCPFSVVFEDGSFRVKYREWDETLMKPVFDSRYLAVMVHAVLGNVNQNPELLVK